MVHRGTLRVEPNRFAACSHCLRVFFQSHKSVAECAVGRSIVWLEADGFAEGGNRRWVVSLVIEDESQVVVRLDEVGLEADSFANGGEGPGIVVLVVAEQTAKIGLRPSVVGLEADRLFVRGDRFVPVRPSHSRRYPGCSGPPRSPV